MRLLRLPDFRRFWLAESLSLLGDQVTVIALPLTAVLVLDASAVEMGYLGAVALGPHLLLSLPAGVWLDRVARRRRVMMAADLGRAAILSSIPLAYALDALTLGHLFAAGFATGCLAVLFDLSYPTVFVSVTPRDRYVEGNALTSGSRSFAYVGGPSLGGFLVQFFGGPFALLADTASYIWSALVLGRVRAAEPPVDATGAETIRRRLGEGLSFIGRHEIFRPGLAAVATINFFNFMFAALFVLYATRELGIRPGTLGLVLGAGAVGGVLGAIASPRVGRALGLGRAFALGCVLFPAPLVLVPLAGGPKPVVLALLFTAEFLAGLGVMILDISFGAIMLALTPDRLRARATGAFRFVNYGVRPLGSLAGGAAGTALGLRPALWIATVGAVAGALWLVPSPVAGLRDLPEEAA